MEANRYSENVVLVGMTHEENSKWTKRVRAWADPNPSAEGSGLQPIVAELE